MSVFSSVWVSDCLSVRLSACISVCVCVRLSTSVCFCPSVCQYVSLSVCHSCEQQIEKVTFKTLTSVPCSSYVFNLKTSFDDFIMHSSYLKADCFWIIMFAYIYFVHHSVCRCVCINILCMCVCVCVFVCTYSVCVYYPMSKLLISPSFYPYSIFILKVRHTVLALTVEQGKRVRICVQQPLGRSWISIYLIIFDSDLILYSVLSFILSFVISINLSITFSFLFNYILSFLFDIILSFIISFIFSIVPSISLSLFFLLSPFFTVLLLYPDTGEGIFVGLPISLSGVRVILGKSSQIIDSIFDFQHKNVGVEYKKMR